MIKEMENRFEEITLDQLPLAVLDCKEKNYRLDQIFCAFVDNKYELTYSFAKDYVFINYRIVIEKDTEVPSISKIFEPAFLYENEMKELFGVNMEYIALDYKNRLYRINEETPFVPKEDK